MDHNGEMPPPRPSLSESIRRRSSLSDKLNNLTSGRFSHRRRTSGTFASSESSASLHRRSRVPTPSFGSRTSSLLGGLKFSNADDGDSTGPRRSNRNGSQDRSILSSRRHSRLASGSTSSFFGNNKSEALYPREFLEDLETGTVGKENESQSAIATSYSQDLLQPGHHYHLDGEVLQDLEPGLVKQSEINNVPSATSSHTGASKQSTPATTRKSRSISTRLANAPYFKLHSARHSLAAVPQSASPRSKERESNVVIEERRLMAPINPPLPRSTTMNIAPNTSLAPARSSSYQSSPRTPNFMRPTSSSAARTTESFRSFKSPPTPLNLPNGAKSDMVGFSLHRKKLAEARQESTASRISHKTRPGFLPGNGLQSMSTTRLGTINEPGQLEFEQLQSPYMTYQSTAASESARRAPARRAPEAPRRLLQPTTVEEAEYNMRSPYDSEPDSKRYPLGSRYASTPDLRGTYASDQPPMPRLPQQFVASPDRATTAEFRQQIAPRAVTEKGHRSVEGESDNAADDPVRIQGRARPFGIFGRPSMGFLRQGSKQSVAEEPVPSMPKTLSAAKSFSNGNDLSNTHRGPPSRIPLSSARTANFQAPQGYGKPFENILQPSQSEYDLSLPRPSFSHAGSSKSSLDDKPLPALPSNTAAQRAFPPRKASLQPSQLSRSNFSSVQLGDNESMNSITPLRHRNVTISSPLAHANLTAPVNSTANEVDEEEEEDITLVHESQNLIYWAGRFSAANDRMRNEALASSAAAWAHNETERHNRALQFLQSKCRTRAAEDSLNGFVTAWRAGWTGGPGLACRADVVLAPRYEAPAAVEEAPKKKTLMGKMKGFGRKKSKE